MRTEREARVRCRARARTRIPAVERAPRAVGSSGRPCERLRPRGRRRRRHRNESEAERPSVGLLATGDPLERRRTEDGARRSDSGRPRDLDGLHSLLVPRGHDKDVIPRFELREGLRARARSGRSSIDRAPDMVRALDSPRKGCRGGRHSRHDEGHAVGFQRCGCALFLLRQDTCGVLLTRAFRVADRG